MPAFTLYAFMTDDAMYQASAVDTNQLASVHGVLAGESANYFVNKGLFNDSRHSRLQVTSSSKKPFGKMALHFDTARVDMDIINSLSDIDRSRIFNILERVAYQAEYSDANIEYTLTNSASFSGYVPYTFMHADGLSTVTILDESKGEVSTILRDWVSFEYTAEGITFKVHVWLNRQTYAKEYPYTTITAVIPPFDPTLLISTATLIQENNMGILESGSSFIFDQTNREMMARDQNGIYTYKTKYVIDNKRTVQLPFALSYCGARVPSSLECRKAIREYLEGAVTIPQAELQLLFPELYVGSRFFVVPLWKEATFLSDRVVYPGIHNLERIKTLAKQIFANYEYSFIEDHLEVMLNAQNKMWCLVLPDTLNDKWFSVYAAHPTYQDYSSQVPGFRYMEAATQDFAALLNRCMAVLEGELVSKEFISTEINDLVYLSFTSGQAEYMVLSKDSYIEAYGEI